MWTTILRHFNKTTMRFPFRSQRHSDLWFWQLWQKMMTVQVIAVNCEKKNKRTRKKLFLLLIFHLIFHSLCFIRLMSFFAHRNELCHLVLDPDRRQKYRRIFSCWWERRNDIFEEIAGSWDNSASSFHHSRQRQGKSHPELKWVLFRFAELDEIV